MRKENLCSVLCKIFTWTFTMNNLNLKCHILLPGNINIVVIWGCCSFFMTNPWRIWNWWEVNLNDTLHLTFSTCFQLSNAYTYSIPKLQIHQWSSSLQSVKDPFLLVFKLLSNVDWWKMTQKVSFLLPLFIVCLPFFLGGGAGKLVSETCVW